MLSELVGVFNNSCSTAELDFQCQRWILNPEGVNSKLILHDRNSAGLLSLLILTPSWRSYYSQFIDYDLGIANYNSNDNFSVGVGIRTQDFIIWKTQIMPLDHNNSHYKQQVYNGPINIGLIILLAL